MTTLSLHSKHLAALSYHRMPYTSKISAPEYGAFVICITRTSVTIPVLTQRKLYTNVLRSNLSYQWLSPTSSVIYKLTTFCTYELYDESRGVNIFISITQTVSINLKGHYIL